MGSQFGRPSDCALSDNKQGTKYSPPSNNLKGMQTAGGNKLVMADTQGDQKILISNSHNKGTAVEVGFKDDGSSIFFRRPGPSKRGPS